MSDQYEPLIPEQKEDDQQQRKRTLNQQEEDQEERQIRSDPLKALPNTKVQPMEVSDIKLKKTNINMLQNLQQYKKRMFIIVSIIFAFFGLIIAERLFSEILREEEVSLLIEVQGHLGLKEGKNNYFLQLIGQMQQFLVLYLLLLHFFVTFYVSFDAIMAIKIMYPTFLGYYVICILELVYKSPRPYWVSSEIVSYTCQKTYSCPSQVAFILLLIILYGVHLYSDKSMVSLDQQVLVGPHRKHRRRLFVQIFGCLFIAIFLFCSYISGLVFLDHIALGIIYFGLFYTFLRIGSSEVNDMIRKTALISDTSKKMIFRWMFSLGIVQMIVTMVYNFSNTYPDVDQLKSFLNCLKNQNKSQYVPLFDIIGPNPTYNESSIVIGIIGQIFGVSYTFRNCKSAMNWYEGRLKKKSIRALIANLFLIPSWILIYYQQDFLQLSQVYDAGLTEFLLNSFHFLCLNFILFGILPVNLFERFKLNKRTDSFIIVGNKKEDDNDPKAFSFFED